MTPCFISCSLTCGDFPRVMPDAVLNLQCVYQGPSPEALLTSASLHPPVYNLTSHFCPDHHDAVL